MPLCLGVCCFLVAFFCLLYVSCIPWGADFLASSLINLILFTYQKKKKKIDIDKSCVDRFQLPDNLYDEGKIL